MNRNMRDSIIKFIVTISIVIGVCFIVSKLIFVVGHGTFQRIGDRMPQIQKGMRVPTCKYYVDWEEKYYPPVKTKNGLICKPIKEIKELKS